MKRSAIIVDDEPLGRERIRSFLKKENDFSIEAECEGGTSAVNQIEALRPDVVFLDIQMPDLDGFGVLGELKKRSIPMPIVIFVTAYDEHAVKAFDVNAIDYLLKPVQRARFQASLDRARDMLSKPDADNWQTKLAEALDSIQPAQAPADYLKRIEIRSQSRTDYVNVDDVYWLEADGNYIEVHTETQSFLARMTMAELESQLDPNRFLRISRSAVVHLSRVRSIQPMGRRGHTIVLEDDRKVHLTRALEELQNRLKFSS